MISDGSLTYSTYCNTAGAKLPKTRLSTCLNIHLGFSLTFLHLHEVKSIALSCVFPPPPPPPPRLSTRRSTLVSPGTLIPRLLYSIILCLDLNNLLTTPCTGLRFLSHCPEDPWQCERFGTRATFFWIRIHSRQTLYH